jgi:hypothetical protein
VFLERLDIAGIAGRLAGLYREVAAPGAGFAAAKAPAKSAPVAPARLASPAPPA